MSRTLEVVFVTPACAYVKGYGSRELLTEMRGRPPMWGSTYRAWHCQPQTARDLIAVAEDRGYVVTVIDEADMLATSTVEADEIRSEHASSKGLLW